MPGARERYLQPFKCGVICKPKEQCGMAALLFCTCAQRRTLLRLAIGKSIDRDESGLYNVHILNLFNK